MTLIDIADILNHDLAEYRDHYGRLGEVTDLISREQRIPALHALEGHTSRVALATRLFILGDTLTLNEYEAVLPSLHLDEAIEAGLITSESEIRSRIAIRPVTVPDHHGGGTLLIASDLGEIAGHTPRTDHVMPVGGATTTLDNMTRYQSGQHVLDLGTGCGWHALVAARQGCEVVATDISQRALDFTQLNATLAGVQIETRLGSLYEPVSEQFDVIVSNPPFVITPQEVRDTIGAYEYRDGGKPGHALLHDVVTGAQHHLTTGGRAWMLGNWEVTTPPDRIDMNDAWADIPREWMQGRDSWVIARDILPPAEYVSMWLGDGGVRSGHDYETAMRQWLTDFTTRGVTAIVFGYLMIGPEGSWFHADNYRGPIDEGFPAHDPVWQNRKLADLSDHELLDLTYTHIPLVENRFHTPGIPDPWHMTLTGYRREIPVSGEVAGFVGACDGELSAKQIATALAALLDTSETDMIQHLLPQLKVLISHGFLTVVE